MKVGSLFTGAGGLDLAVRQLWPDAQLAWWSEVDEHAAASFARHTDAPNLGDITAIDWTTVEPVDIVFGGFPCQDLSHAGKRAGLSADRSGLWFHMLDAINTLRPRLVLLENVTGIYTATGEDDDGLDVERNPMDRRAAEPARAIDVVLGTLAEDGWDAEWADYRASAVGAPHRRARWFCVAYPHDPRLEGWDGGGMRECAGQRPVGQGDPPAAVTLLLTPRSSDGPKGGPGQVNGRGVPDSLPAISALLPTPTSQPEAPTDRATRLARVERAREKHGRPFGESLQSTVSHLLPTPTSQAAKHGTPTPYEVERWESCGLDRHNLWVHAPMMNDQQWGDYAAAIVRWEHVTGRPAPAPTDSKGRLSPSFVEWMMGWPPNFTTGSRSQRLKQCGNGVVPLQAATAYRQLFDRIGHNNG